MTQERNRRIAWSAGIGALQRGLQLLCALIILPLALRHLGVEGFGLWGAATSLVWLTGMLDIGLGSALITLISEAVANARPDLVTTHVTAALAAGTIIAAGIILTIAAAPSAWADETQPRDHHVKTWTDVLIHIPCRDFQHNPDGSWTLPGTLIVDETGRTFSDLTYTLEPPQDNGAKVLALRCASKTSE